MSEKDKKIWKTVASIPRGQVATYGQIADLAGCGRAARMVGRSMGKAPKSQKLPWHRVVNAAGQISLPVDSSGYKTQRQRLLSEGIEFRGKRIDMKKYQWQPTLDELLWKLDG
ncbi:MAG: MGMT family protein [Gammaproteobacteria bacterium]